MSSTNIKHKPITFPNVSYGCLYNLIYIGAENIYILKIEPHLQILSFQTLHSRNFPANHKRNSDIIALWYSIRIMLINTGESGLFTGTMDFVIFSLWIYRITQASPGATIRNIGKYHCLMMVMLSSHDNNKIRLPFWKFCQCLGCVESLFSLYSSKVNTQMKILRSLQSWSRQVYL